MRDEDVRSLLQEAVAEVERVLDVRLRGSV